MYPSDDISKEEVDLKYNTMWTTLTKGEPVEPLPLATVYLLEHTDGVLRPPSAFSLGGGSLPPFMYADACCVDAVVGSKADRGTQLEHSEQERARARSGAGQCCCPV